MKRRQGAESEVVGDPNDSGSWIKRGVPRPGRDTLTPKEFAQHQQDLHDRFEADVHAGRVEHLRGQADPVTPGVFELVRDPLVVGARETFGELIIDGVSFCYTLEPPWRNNQKSISCIPAGAYPVRMVWSSRFGRQTPHLTDVHARTDIMFHPGNVVAETQGCILVGNAIAHNPEDHVDSGGVHHKQGPRIGVAASRNAYDRFVVWFSKVGFMATVTVRYREEDQPVNATLAEAI